MPQDIYKIVQALKERQASAPKPANHNRFSINNNVRPDNDNTNLMIQPSQVQQTMAMGDRNIAPNQGSNPYGFLASRNIGQNKAQPSQPSSTQGAANSTNNAESANIIYKKSNFQVGDRIDLTRFTQKVKETSDLKDPKSGQVISLDRALNSGTVPHGPSYWKLKDKFGEKIGSFTKDGYLYK